MGIRYASCPFPKNFGEIQVYVEIQAKAWSLEIELERKMTRDKVHVVGD